MLPYLIIPAMAVAGYLGAPWWVVLLGAAGIVSEGWWLKVQRLRQRPRQPWSTKTTAYFVTGILANIGLSAVSYGIARIVHAMAG